MTKIEIPRVRNTPKKMRVWHRRRGWLDCPGGSPSQATWFAAETWGMDYHQALSECRVSVIPQSDEETAAWWNRYFPGTTMPQQEGRQAG